MTVVILQVVDDKSKGKVEDLRSRDVGVAVRTRDQRTLSEKLVW